MSVINKKLCNTCYTVKPLSEFNKNGDKGTKIRPTCKRCYNDKRNSDRASKGLVKNPRLISAKPTVKKTKKEIFTREKQNHLNRIVAAFSTLSYHNNIEPRYLDAYTNIYNSTN